MFKYKCNKHARIHSDHSHKLTSNGRSASGDGSVSGSPEWDRSRSLLNNFNSVDVRSCSSITTSSVPRFRSSRPNDERKIYDAQTRWRTKFALLPRRISLALTADLAVENLRLRRGRTIGPIGRRNLQSRAFHARSSGSGAISFYENFAFSAFPPQWGHRVPFAQSEKTEVRFIIRRTLSYIYYRANSRAKSRGRAWSFIVESRTYNSVFVQS